MGKKDYAWREPKKAKKDAKKRKGISGLLPQAEVEVIKKGKREPSVEE
jgi:hypothetical protein